MSLSTKEIHEGAVSSISGTDLVMVSAPGGGYHPIPFTSLMTAIRNGIQIGGRNLLKNSNTAKTTAQTYEFSKALEIGKTYTLTACISLAAKDSRIALSLNGASFYDAFVEYESSACVNRIVTKTVKLTNPSVNFYVFGKDGKITCHWATVTEGNMPSTCWFPAPEDIASGNWRGGVNQRFTISYNLPSDECEKGGAHDADEGAGGCAESSAGGYFSFGTLDSLCEFIGQTVEGCHDERVADRSEYSRARGMADCGLFQDQSKSVECELIRQELNECGFPYYNQPKPEFGTQRVWLSSLGIGSDGAECSVCGSEAFDGFSIASRKEVTI